MKKAYVAHVAVSVAIAIALVPDISSSSKTVSAAEAITKNDPVNGMRWLRALGPAATDVFAPVSGEIAGLVRLPPGATAASLGLEPVNDRFARVRGSREHVLAFADAHPDASIEVSTPLHLLLDSAGRWTRSITAHQNGVDGRGALVGVADTGIDATHADFRTPDGKSRIAWMLDLSLRPLGLHADLEQQFSVKDGNGKPTLGAILNKDDIDTLLANGGGTPTDVIGHGSHVTGIAAGSGGNGTNAYAGMAPGAQIISVRLTRGASDAIENDDLVRAVQFMFDRADADKKPIAVNISLGSDFGSHDGNMAWEQVLASYVGSDRPGHAIIAAAGNSGSIVDAPIHQIVRVAKGSRMRVPVQSGGATRSGTVRVWAALTPGARADIGLEGPDGSEWIAPQTDGASVGLTRSGTNVSLVYGSNARETEVPAGSRGAIVAWSGPFPKGVYNVTFDGEGLINLYLEAYGEAASGEIPTAFLEGVREGTINLPATNPSIIGVGCTVNKVKWVSYFGQVDVAFRVPNLDPVGGRPISDSTKAFRPFTDGEVCYFSSAGPNVNGVPKPEISAPGGIVGSTMSSQAAAGNAGSIFTNPVCPRGKDGASDPKCYQVDPTHAISAGTSMAAPMVAGVVALLFQKDPTLTQDKITALLQAGAHPFRGTALFDDQSGPGELDAIGALDALDKMQNPTNAIPDASSSWATLSSGFVAADGKMPMTVILELRTAKGDRADFFDRTRLSPVVRIGDRNVDIRNLVRKGPGLWTFSFTAPPGYGGTFATVGAAFDGAAIVPTKRVVVATDPWNARYSSSVAGGACATAVTSEGAGEGGLPRFAGWASLALLVAYARPSRRPKTRIAA